MNAATYGRDRSTQRQALQVSTGETPPIPSGFRYYGGWFFFLLSFFMPLLGLAVPMLGLDKGLTTIIVGAMVVGGPEVAGIVAISLWGKETFSYFVGRAKGLVKLPETVSPTRYKIGLAMFLLSALPCWVLAYFPHWVADRIPILITADLVFLASFFVLGGQFWGKLRALFTADPQLAGER